MTIELVRKPPTVQPVEHVIMTLTPVEFRMLQKIVNDSYTLGAVSFVQMFGGYTV